MESHYTRSSSRRLYLDPNLTIKKMHELFCSQFSEKYPGVKAPSEYSYRQVFCNDFNLAFFAPKKDQCMTCTKYSNLTEDAKIAFKGEYDAHKERKESAHVAKNEDKIRANSNPEIMSVTFDLQSVLQIPSCQASLLYYMRKLCVYNLTVYQQAKPNDAYCFTWQETEGKRGAIEIGTCLLEYLKTLPTTVTELSLWSDTCSGQNRNQFIAAMFLYALRSMPHLKKITHNYLESGHSSMEADSMHSSIETEKKNRRIFQCLIGFLFSNVQEDATHTIKHGDFLNFQLLAKSIIKNRTKNTDGETLNWLKVKRFQYRQGETSNIFYSYDYRGDFKIIDIRGTRGRSGINTVCEVHPAYTKRIHICVEKKNDLLKLCRELVIPEEFHGWFNNLPVSSHAKNMVPEPAVNDSDDDDNE